MCSRLARSVEGTGWLGEAVCCSCHHQCQLIRTAAGAREAGQAADGPAATVTAAGPNPAREWPVDRHRPEYLPQPRGGLGSYPKAAQGYTLGTDQASISLKVPPTHCGPNTPSCQHPAATIAYVAAYPCPCSLLWVNVCASPCQEGCVGTVSPHPGSAAQQ